MKETEARGGGQTSMELCLSFLCCWRLPLASIRHCGSPADARETSAQLCAALPMCASVCCAVSGFVHVLCMHANLYSYSMFTSAQSTTCGAQISRGTCTLLLIFTGDNHRLSRHDY